MTLDPLVGMEDMRKPLRSKLLAVPKFRAKYLENVKAIAREGLAWENLGARVNALRKVLEPEVKADTRKNSSYEAFISMTSADGGLRQFADARRKFLLEYKGGQ